MARGILNGIVTLFVGIAFLLPYIGGAFTAYVLIVLSLILMVWNLLSPQGRSADAGAWMFLVAWSLIAIAFAITNQPGRTDFLLAANFAMFALYPMIAGAVQRVASPHGLLRVAILALLGAAIALAVAAVQVFVFAYQRAEGFGSNPIPSATVALFLGFFALVGLFAVKDARRYFFLVGPVIGLVTVFLAESRGPLIAIPALVLIALVMLPIRRSILVGGVAAVIAAGGLAYAVNPAAFKRIDNLPSVALELVTGAEVDRETDNSGYIRYRILRGSLAAFRDSPWLGYGWYMKVPVVERYIEDPVRFGDPKSAHLHSDLLNLGVSAGLVGLLAYALAIFAPIVSAARAPRDSQYRGRLYLALTLSAGFLFCGAVNLLFGFEFMTTMYVVWAAIFIAYCRDTPAPADR